MLNEIGRARIITGRYSLIDELFIVSESSNRDFLHLRLLSTFCVPEPRHMTWCIRLAAAHSTDPHVTKSSIPHVLG